MSTGVTIRPELHEALSGIFGSVSLAAWIFLLLPQLFENYKSQSAEGISLAFLIVWFIGDVTNLIGAIWAGLVPTVIALAIYFCFADTILITQCLYYNTLNARKAAAQQDGAPYGTATDDPSQPLLRSHSGNIGLPGSRRRSSAASKTTNSTSLNSLPTIIEEESTARMWTKNVPSVVFVCVVGTAGWAIAWKIGAWIPTPEEIDNGEGEGPIGAQVLGYISAVCYLGARIPQIVKNHKERSCDGLSLLFFILSMIGNVTYGAGILLHSVEKQYFLTNLPWLIGSLGTIGEDTLIFIQFHMYAKKEDVEVSSALE